MIVTMLSIREDPTMMRNGCLTLCQFNIPQDVLFDYERLVTSILIYDDDDDDDDNDYDDDVYEY